MLQRWSNRLTWTLRASLRRGGLFVLASLMAITLTMTPVMSRPASAQGFTDLLSLGGSFTNGLSSCAIETVGWVICPTMRSIAKLADYGFGYINQNFLTIDYTIAANDSGTYRAWEIMRNVANGLFVIAFMALVYSQLTGRNSGSYNIKRLVPRLVIAAVLVNVSYFVCVFFIDISNILGDSILFVLTDVASRVGTSIMPVGQDNVSAFQDGPLTVITSAVLAKTGTAWVLLAPVAAVTVSIATISAVMLVLLIMRKTVVALLILAAPILFVAYLLPNLEKYFMQGVRLFTQLLLLYPIIALLLGAGQIVSSTIVTVGTGDTNYRVSGDSYFSRNGGSGSAITDLTAAAAAVLPLLAECFIFKNMSSVMSTAGSKLQASIASRRRNGEDEKAQVTGKATAGAQNSKQREFGGLGTGRKQAFSRNRRRSSLGGSSMFGGADEAEGRARVPTKPKSQPGEATNAAENAATPNANSLDEAAKRFEELQNAQISGEAGLEVDDAVAAAVAGNKEQEDEKSKTAKDIFNNMNRSHESKDKERKFGAGPPPAGGGGQSGGGTPQQAAPTSSYKAPQMAQSANIVSGAAPAPQQQAKVVAVPVQIDGSALLGQNNQNQHHPPENVSQPPISGTEEKAKARAQKYIFDSQRDIDEAQRQIDILSNKKDEPPHTESNESKDKDSGN